MGGICVWAMGEGAEAESFYTVDHTESTEIIKLDDNLS